MDAQVMRFVLADFTFGWTRTDNGSSISYRPAAEIELAVVREGATGNLTTYFYAFGPSSGDVLVVGDVIHIPFRFTRSAPGDQITNPSGSPLPFHRPVDRGGQTLP